MRPHPRAKGYPYQRKLFIRRVLHESWSVATSSGTLAGALASGPERAGALIRAPA
jgi:hypothetical protein